MINGIYACITTVTNCLQILSNTCKLIFNLNYQFVSSLGYYLCQTFYFLQLITNSVKNAVVVATSFLSDCATEVYLFLESIHFLVSRFSSLVCEFFCCTYISIGSMMKATAESVTDGAIGVRNCVVSVCSFIAAGATQSVSFVVTSVTAVYLLVTWLGSLCVNFVTGVWFGLGFVFSSIASFPTFVVRSVSQSWSRLTDTLALAFKATSTETYLGIVMLCLLYLLVSNFVRYFSCHSIPLFSQRALRRRNTRRNDPWLFDAGFESDQDEEYYILQATGRPTRPAWRNLVAGDDDGESSEVVNNDSSSSDSEGSDNEGNNNGAISDTDDSDDSTIVSDDTSDNEDNNSINSLTFSTGSGSDLDIEVQLPPLDQHYSLRSRSSTPARPPGKAEFPACREEFDRAMEQERDKRKCVVCQDEIKSVLVMPCRHMCMCVVCANHIVRSRTPGRKVCPLCRTRITKVINVYV